MNTFTIFSVPKAFTGHNAIIQSNAIQSWTRLEPSPQIILFGDEPGIAESCETYNLTHIPSIQLNSCGTPRLDFIFDYIEKHCSAKLQFFVNADIILFSDIYEAAGQCLDKFDQFLIIGRRIELRVNEILSFADSGWEEDVKLRASREGFLQRPSHKDYFLFTRGLWKNMPGFAIGRASYDNAMVQYALDEKIPVIDATRSVTAVHQTHDYSHLKGGHNEAYKGKEATANYELAQKWLGKSVVNQGYIDQTSWIFDQGGKIVPRNKNICFDESLRLHYALKEKGWNYKYDLYACQFAYTKTFNKVESPAISVIVVSWRRHPDTLQNLQIISRQRSVPFELILVNNGAPEEELAELEQYTDVYVKLKNNTGPCFARNAGAMFSSAPLLFFLEDDGIPADDVIQSHLKAFDRFEIIALRGVYSPKTSDNPLNERAKHYYLGDKIFPIDINLEGNTTLKSKYFFMAGGWDEDIFIMADGLALTMRLLKVEPCMLMQIYYPDAIIYHDYARDEKHLENKMAQRRKSLSIIKEKYPDYQKVRELYKRLCFQDHLVPKRGQNNMDLIHQYDINAMLGEKTIKNGLSVIISLRDSTIKLGSLLERLLDVCSIHPNEFIIIDNGAQRNVKEAVQKYATQVFIRFLQCKKNDCIIRWKEIASQKAFFSGKIYIEINQTSLKWSSDFPDVQSGLREEADQIKDRLEAYVRGYSQEERANQDVFRPSPEQNILFVLPEGIDSKHGYQARLLARMLQAQGFRCTIAVPDASLSKISSPTTGHRSPTTVSYSSLLTSDVWPLTSGPPDLIHAWTPRENVRKICEKLLERLNSRLMIHLIENEEYLTEVRTGKPWSALVALSKLELDKIIPDDCYHPRKGKALLDKADGLTMVIDTLNRFNTRNVPYQVIPPLVDERLFYPRPINKELRAKHNIPDDTTILVYTGNVHAGNKDEVFELYKAMDLLNQQDRPAKLLRTGQDNNDLEIDTWPGKHVIHLGWVNRKELPDILAAADILVQPGKPGPYNDERIPCKLSEYFAMARPVVMPRTNLGLKVEHGVEGHLLDKADAEGIANSIKQLCSKKLFYDKLSQEANNFYIRNIINGLIYIKLYLFYKKFCKKNLKTYDKKHYINTNQEKNFRIKYGVPVTIVIPNYNKENFLRRSLNSVAEQTYKNIQVIIVDDFSSDNSKEIIYEFINKDQRFKIINNKENKGASKSRDIGIKNAQTNLVTTLDSDDFYPNKHKIENEVRLIIHYAEKGEKIIAFSKMCFYDSHGIKIRDDKRIIVEGNIFKHVFARDRYIPHHFLFYKFMYLESGGLDHSLPIYEDWDLKIRLASLYNFYCTGSEGYAYVNPGYGLSGSKKELHMQCLGKIFHKNIHLTNPGNYNYIVNGFKVFFKNAFKVDFDQVKPRLYIHMGASKTGTTTLQRISDINQNNLFNAGIYCIKGIKASSIASSIAFKIGFKDHDHLPWLQILDINEELKEVARKCTSDSLHSVVVSSEYFWDSFSFFYSDFNTPENYRKFLTATRKVFNEYDVKVVLYIRRPDEHFESIIKESVKSVAPLEVAKLFQSFAPTYDFCTRFTILEDVFGSKNLFIRFYEGETRKDVVRDFFLLIGVEGYPANFNDLPDDAKNHSLQPLFLEVMHVLRGSFQGTLPLKQLSRLLSRVIKISKDVHRPGKNRELQQNMAKELILEGLAKELKSFFSSELFSQIFPSLKSIILNLSANKNNFSLPSHSRVLFNIGFVGNFETNMLDSLKGFSNHERSSFKKISDICIACPSGSSAVKSFWHQYRTQTYLEKPARRTAQFSKTSILTPCLKKSTSISSKKYNCPIFSIITATLNLVNNDRIEFFKEMIDSVAIQDIDRSCYEHIVIDGGSNDGTLKLLDAYKQKGFIDILYSEPDRGIYEAMNKGISFATGKYINFLNSDDYFAPDALNKIIDIYKKHSPEIILGQCDIIDLDGNFVAQRTVSLNRIFWGMPVAHQSMFVKSHVFKKIGVFNTVYSIAGDFDFVWRLYKNNCYFYITDSLISFFRDGGVSMENKNKRLSERTRVLWDHFYSVIGMQKFDMEIVDSIINDKFISDFDFSRFIERICNLPSSALINEFRKSLYLLLGRRFIYAIRKNKELTKQCNQLSKGVFPFPSDSPRLV